LLHKLLNKHESLLSQHCRDLRELQTKVNTVLVQKPTWDQLHLGSTVRLVTTQNELVDRRLPPLDIRLVNVQVHSNVP
jgi:hypothetical protein